MELTTSMVNVYTNRLLGTIVTESSQIRVLDGSAIQMTVVIVMIRMLSSKCNGKS